MNSTFQQAANRLAAVIEERAPGLRAISEDRSLWRYGEGKWSKREILGHLIDSAANNHQRFVRAPESGVLDHPTNYDENEWVAAQRYHDEPWANLVNLWIGYNRHMAHVIASLPDTKRDVLCRVHFPKNVTLLWISHDYVDHMNHHLRQIFEEDSTGYGTVSFIHPDDR